ncbi:MAG: phosphoadenosine phosphosulfate reductase family protein [Clostridia bacterium]
MKNIVQFSGGKDSTAMLIGLLERDIEIDEAVFFDTGWEFDSVYRNIDFWQTRLGNIGIPFTVLKPKLDFDYQAFEKLVQHRDGTTSNGYAWCGGVCRWGTTEKVRELERYCYGNNELVGFAVDEQQRIGKDRKGIKQYPLNDWGVTERQALQMCYDNKVEYVEDGVDLQQIRLYDILDRGSCFCCGNKNLKELKGTYQSLPQYWERLKQMQSKTDRLYKKVGLQALEHKFEKELL